LSAQGPKINSNQTEGRSQAIAANQVELEKEIWLNKKIQNILPLQNLTPNLFKIFF
jgi:hypothetical protein